MRCILKVKIIDDRQGVGGDMTREDLEDWVSSALCTSSLDGCDSDALCEAAGGCCNEPLDACTRVFIRPRRGGRGAERGSKNRVWGPKKNIKFFFKGRHLTRSH